MRRAFFITLTVAAIALCARYIAANSHDDALDPLFHASTDIVIATLTQAPDSDKGTYDKFDVNVTTPLYGSMYPGMKFPIYGPMDIMGDENTYLYGYYPIESGQNLILFMDLNRPTLWDPKVHS